MSEQNNKNLQKAFIKNAYKEYVREASKNRPDEVEYSIVSVQKKEDDTVNANS